MLNSINGRKAGKFADIKKISWKNLMDDWNALNRKQFLFTLPPFTDVCVYTICLCL